MAFKDEIARLARSENDIIKGFETEIDNALTKCLSPQRIKDHIKDSIKEKALRSDWTESSFGKRIEGIISLPPIGDRITVNLDSCGIYGSPYQDYIKKYSDRIYTNEYGGEHSIEINSVDFSAQKLQTGLGIFKSTYEHKFRVTLYINPRWLNILSESVKLCLIDDIKVTYGIRVKFAYNEEFSYYPNNNVVLDHWCQHSCNPYAYIYLDYYITI